MNLLRGNNSLFFIVIKMVKCKYCNKQNVVIIDSKSNNDKFLCYDCNKTFLYKDGFYRNHRGEMQVNWRNENEIKITHRDNLRQLSLS